MNLKKLVFCFCVLFGLGAYGNSRVDVDLHRYLGTWYELARLPNAFQEKCAGEVSAHYRPLKSGEIAVTNSCLTHEGLKSTAHGLAWQEDLRDTSKLKVSFVPLLKHLHLFAGDYWIFALDDDYSWAIVGSPDRKYLWLLCRDIQATKNKLDMLKSKAQEFGFNIVDIILNEVFDK